MRNQQRGLFQGAVVVEVVVVMSRAAVPLDRSVLPLHCCWHVELMGAGIAGVIAGVGAGVGASKPAWWWW